jgi:zinc/manganese transport system substrate-binding protein
MYRTIHLVKGFAVAAALLVCLSTSTQAQEESKLEVVCTLGILGDLAQQVGGDLVSVKVLSSPLQDPHFVEPRPTLMRKARKADAFLMIGLQLELWADKVVTGSGNAAIQPGQPGHVIASAGIATLERPSVLSREWGDVHPNGNPHVWLDPINAKLMAANLERAFSRLDPAHSERYRSNLSKFEKRVDEALFGAELLKQFGASKLTRLARNGKLMDYLKLRKAEDMLGGWLKKAQPLAGKNLISYHKTFTYFTKRFGMQVPMEVEGKPGIPPGPKHKASVLELMRSGNVLALMQASYFERKTSESLCAKSERPLLVVPIDVGPEGPAQDLFGMIDLILDELLRANALGAE